MTEMPAAVANRLAAMQRRTLQDEWDCACAQEQLQQQQQQQNAAAFIARAALLKARHGVSDDTNGDASKDVAGVAAHNSCQSHHQQCEALQQAVSLQQRVQLLKQRQADKQTGAVTAVNPASATAAPQQPSILQRWQVLQERQDIRQQSADDSPSTAGAAAAQHKGMQQQSSEDQLQHPDDFVQHMKQLLEAESFCEEWSAGDLQVDGDNDAMRCSGSEQGEDGARICAAAADAADAATAVSSFAALSPVPDPMCVSPVKGRETNGHFGTDIAAAAASTAPRQLGQQTASACLDTRQQQPQGHEAEPAVPGHLRRLLVLASHSLTAGQFAEARDRAAAALSGAVSNSNSCSTSSLSSFCRDAERLQAAAIVLDQAPKCNWLAALQLQDAPDSGSAAFAASTAVTATIVKRAYKRLAALIHPDKCKHQCAESAFKALTSAYDQALSELGAAASGPADRDDAGSDDDWASTSQPVQDVDSDYAWWTEWEQDVADGYIAGGAAAAGGRAGTGSRSTAPTAADDEDELWRLSMQELVAEVERRQAGILQPQSPADVARTAIARQKRLRVARTVLSARLQQQRTTAAGVQDGVNVMDVGIDGGFVQGQCGGQDGSSWVDEEQQGVEWKRQRL